MMELAGRWPAVLALASMAGVVCAQSDKPGSGPAFYNSNCASSTFVGGVQIGDNFQYKRLVWGFEADLDVWGGGNRSQTLKYAGEAPPAGTYTASGRLSPSDFLMIAPRIGYGGTLWMPYVTAGAIAALGSQDSALSYTPTDAAKPTASFSGGKNFTSTGWVAGDGAAH